jgi:hypothetical protein
MLELGASEMLERQASPSVQGVGERLEEGPDWDHFEGY